LPHGRRRNTNCLTDIMHRPRAEPLQLLEELAFGLIQVGFHKNVLSLLRPEALKSRGPWPCTSGGFK
jgi:hypothetical protein